MIRVVLPTHLWRLANVNREIRIAVEQPITLGSVLDALETQYPMLRGTIRDQSTQQRRDFIRFFVCGEDWSHEVNGALLPEAVTTGAAAVLIVGAMAGG
jgi:molybdopterin synthase sulfur carrier subunit